MTSLKMVICESPLSTDWAAYFGKGILAEHFYIFPSQKQAQKLADRVNKAIELGFIYIDNDGELVNTGNKSML